MIGKIKDAVSAAFVLGAVDKAGAMQQKPEAPDGIVERKESAAENVINSVREAAQSSSDVADKFGHKNEQEPSQQQQQLDAETVSNLTQELNKLMREINCDIEFQYSQEVNLMTVRMVDKETKEVLREYPPEDMIKGMIKARDWLGAFLDKNA